MATIIEISEKDYSSQIRRSKERTSILSKDLNELLNAQQQKEKLKKTKILCSC